MISRRQFLRASAAASAGLLAGVPSAPAAPLKGRKPNIILVITDDQGYGDLSCHGNPVLKTPQLDALHAKSTRLTKFFVSPTCAPTRSALMSGRHEFKNGVTHTLAERERLSLKTFTLPSMLKQAGYTTGMFGKWHLGDEPEYQPEKRGFDEAFNHGAGGIGQHYPGNSCGDAPPNQQNRYYDPVIRHNGILVKTKGFCTDVFFRQALGWINARRKQPQPFFAYLTTNAPHGPFIAPDKYTKPFLDKGLNKNLAGFFGMIVNIDDNMGLLMRKLAEWKLEENTLLIFITDNGSSSGARTFNAGMKGAKGSQHEGGTRVPAFLRWKGTLGEGVDVNRLTAHLDFFPTFAELAGGQLPGGGQVEGRSLAPLLENPQAEWADRFLFTHRGRWKFGQAERDKFNNCAVRSERFRFVDNKELYDMDADPGQTTNIIDQHPAVVKKMRAAYDKWWAETVPLMVNEDARWEGKTPFEKYYEAQLKTTGIPDWTPPEI